jgi:hypothetical protein
VNARDSVVSEMRFELAQNKNVLLKNDLALLNVIAANKWKRPIYFTSPYGELGFGGYLRADGLSYRLVPVQIKSENNVNQDVAYNNMMNKFGFGSANIPGVYFDEENRRHLLTIRQAYASAASDMADDGRKEEAKKLLEKCDKGVTAVDMPYGLVSRGNQHNIISISLMEAAYKAGYTDMADRINRDVKRDIEQQLSYYAALGHMSQQELQQNMQTPDELNARQKNLYSEIDQSYRIQGYLGYLESKYKPGPKPNAETPLIMKSDSPKPAPGKADSTKKKPDSAKKK